MLPTTSIHASLSVLGSADMAKVRNQVVPSIGGETLALQGICVKSVNASYGDRFLPYSAMPTAHRMQRRGPTVISISGGSRGSNTEKVELFQFLIGMGVRLITRDPEEGGEVPDENIIAVVDAEFAVVYALVEGREEPSDDALNEFAALNVPFNVWPYWRELLQSTSMRMGLSPIVLPLRHFQRPSPKKALASSE